MILLECRALIIKLTVSWETMLKVWESTLRGLRKHTGSWESVVKLISGFFPVQMLILPLGIKVCFHGELYVPGGE